MAQIIKKTNKKGEMYYKIRVSCGYINGKHITKSMTFKPQSTSLRKIEKEVAKAAMVFEDKCHEVSTEAILANKMTFRDIAEKWLDFEIIKGELKKGTLEVYKGMRKRIYEYLGDMPLTDINRGHIQDFILILAQGKDGQKPLMQKTQKNYLAFISKTCSYAVKYNYLVHSPCSEIDVCHTEAKERCPYTLEEEIELLKKFDEHKVSAQIKAYYMLLIYLGLRSGEGLGIQWSDIDFKSGVVSIRKNLQYQNASTGIYLTTPKTKRSVRRLQLPDKVLALLPQVLSEQQKVKAIIGDSWHENNLVFTTWDGQPVSPRYPYTWLKRFCNKHEIPFKGLHSFRHALVTNLIYENENVATVSSIVGHSNPNVTLGIYTHEIAEHTIAGCNTFSKLIEQKHEEPNEATG